MQNIRLSEQETAFQVWCELLAEKKIRCAECLHFNLSPKILKYDDFFNGGVWVRGDGKYIHSRHVPFEVLRYQGGRYYRKIECEILDQTDMLTLPAAMEQFEAMYIEMAMNVTGGNRSAAAKVLGISHSGLYQRLNRIGKRAMIAHELAGI